MITSRRIAVAVLGLGLVALLARVSGGADQTVLGRVFLVANPDAGDAAKRRVKIVARELSGSTTILGDPTVDGATLFIVASDANPPPEAGHFFALPATAWSTTPSGFVYRDEDGVHGAVRVARISDNGLVFQVKVVLGPRAPFAIPVLPPTPGIDGGATLTITGGDSYCMRFGGPAGGKVRNVPADVGGRLFKITRPMTEAGCVQCSDQGGEMCGGACGLQQFCYPGARCQCIFIFGTLTTTTSSSTSTTSSTIVPGPAAGVSRPAGPSAA